MDHIFLLLAISVKLLITEWHRTWNTVRVWETWKAKATSSSWATEAQK